MLSPLEIVLLLLVLCLSGRLWTLARRQRRAHAAQRSAEDQLAQAHVTLTRINQAVESASDAIGIGDMESNSLYHNHAHVALFGYTVAELNAVDEPAALFADKDVARQIHDRIRAGQSWSGETEVKTRDGRRVPAFVRADIIRDPEGHPVGIFGVFTDITERRRTERLIEEQRRRLEVTLQSIGDAVITTDAAGAVLLINPVAEELTGWSQARAVGRPIQDLLTPRDETTREPRALPVTALLADPAASRSADAYLLRKPDGDERLIAENAALIRDTDGRVAGAVLALRDVTRERKRSDEAARAGKLESLGLLAGGIAHDFGNLLTAMIGHLGLAQNVPGLPPLAVSRLAQVEKVVWRAKDVAQQLVTFAKGGSPQKASLLLGPILRETARLAIGTAPVELHLELAPDLWPVLADETQLVQVFNNLAINAVQAMPAGGSLRLQAENHVPSPDSATPHGETPAVRVRFIDTGGGIRPEHLTRIFDPFFTTKTKGTGLGLATCYSIVTKHGGHLRVESTVGAGTTFTLLLPAVAEVAPARPSGPAPLPAGLIGRVLVVQGEQAVRESLVLMLGLLDCEVAATRPGDEALEACARAQAQARPFDLVVLDLDAPEDPGAVATWRQLKALLPSSRALGLTAHPADHRPHDPPGHDLAIVLSKRVKMAEMKALLTALLPRA